jgi:hypothetical protein
MQTEADHILAPKLALRIRNTTILWHTPVGDSLIAAWSSDGLIIIEPQYFQMCTVVVAPSKPPPLKIARKSFDPYGLANTNRIILMVVQALYIDGVLDYSSVAEACGALGASAAVPLEYTEPETIWEQSITRLLPASAESFTEIELQAIVAHVHLFDGRLAFKSFCWLDAIQMPHVAPLIMRIAAMVPVEQRTDLRIGQALAAIVLFSTPVRGRGDILVNCIDGNDKELFTAAGSKAVQQACGNR